MAFVFQIYLVIPCDSNKIPCESVIPPGDSVIPPGDSSDSKGLNVIPNRGGPLGLASLRCLY